MKNASDRRSSKLVLIAFVFVFVYLAFFSFDLRDAYDYTLAQLAKMYAALGF